MNPWSNEMSNLEVAQCMVHNAIAYGKSGNLDVVMVNLEIIDKLFVIKPSFEMITPSLKYLTYITKNPDLIVNHIEELRGCFGIIHEINGGYGKFCGSFATFEDNGKLKGKKYTISSKNFVRTTLTNKENHHVLLNQMYT